MQVPDRVIRLADRAWHTYDCCAGKDCDYAGYDSDRLKFILETVAPLIAARALRAEADLQERMAGERTGTEVIRRIRARADQIDPDGGKR